MTGQDVTSRFNEIYDSTHKTVLAFVTAKCRNTADIADIVQDTYVEVYLILRKRGTDYIKNAATLTLRIARQKLSRYYALTERMKMFVPMTVVNADGGETDLSELSAFEADSFLTEDFVVNKSVLDEVREFVRGKPQDVKKVFYLFYDLEQTIPQIAKSLSMSESNVKHKLYRTLKEIREKLN
ncbi:MAG: sigma-70 family RNA polymerase sigma factor [Oscillospiraceae bacterium]|jgi:RNA polymerase sigma-70 factor (ECF subfamily)|nr:sigma-70 family RNA polymerase sigma factor [Oscillospiraceae bacterium]